MRLPLSLAFLALAGGLWAGALGAASPEAAVAERMRATASAFLAGLDEGQREAATFTLDDPERRAWSNLPHSMFARRGVRLGDLNDAQRRLAHRMIEAPLSSAGYQEVCGIIRMDEILHELVEPPDRDPPAYGAAWYWLGVFGDPTRDARWGWQLDGHHLALNFTVDGGQVSVTPTFLGANPLVVPEGPSAGRRFLGGIDEAGRRVFASLGAEQRAQARLADEAPGDVFTGPTRGDALTEVVGLPVSALDAQQRTRFEALLDAWLGLVDGELEARERARLNAARGSLHFGWAGSLEAGPYYYRVHGTGLLIEFAAFAGVGRGPYGPNHVHAVWRVPQGDYGAALAAPAPQDGE